MLSVLFAGMQGFSRSYNITLYPLCIRFDTWRYRNIVLFQLLNVKIIVAVPFFFFTNLVFLFWYFTAVIIVTLVQDILLLTFAGYVSPHSVGVSFCLSSLPPLSSCHAHSAFLFIFLRTLRCWSQQGITVYKSWKWITFIAVLCMLILPFCIFVLVSLHLGICLHLPVYRYSV